jgi:hypothetical protein
MPFISEDEANEYFEKDTTSDKPTSNWNPWYRGEAVDVRHESDGTGTIIGRASDSHSSVDKDHLHYVNHDDGTRTVHHSDRTNGYEHYQTEKEESTCGMDGFFNAVTTYLGFDKK